jgi:hypothetical protein
MGKRGRKRSGGAGGQRASSPEMTAQTTIYRDPADAGELELRGSLTAKARTEYMATLTGGRNREDAWQRATELLFERLAVAWTIAGVRSDRQQELLRRYRVASGDERQFVRDSLRAHLAANFPELEAP